jgi:hypothetical protein
MLTIPVSELTVTIVPVSVSVSGAAWETVTAANEIINRTITRIGNDLFLILFCMVFPSFI